MTSQINFDWSDANAVWQNNHPHDNEAVLVKQCEMVKVRARARALSLSLSLSIYTFNNLTST